MTNTNKNLVRVGHELAATMTADTPIIEIAKLVTRLATALDVQTALVAQLTEQRDAVVADNAGLKSALTAILQPGEATLSREHRAAAVTAIETPATSAILNSLRAEGVEMFAAEMSAQHQKLQSGGYFDRQVVIYAKLSEPASSFARQLRESKGAQK